HLLGQNRIRTTSGFGIALFPDIHICAICACANEDQKHLFFQCGFSGKCVDFLSRKIGIGLPCDCVWEWWNVHRFVSMFHKKVIGALLEALIYHIWFMRNRSFHDGVLCRPEVVLKMVCNEVVIRCRSQVLAHVLSKYGSWLESIRCV
ncbi:hypothetical protein RND81_07G029400, partial [Saponaria officinalis]